MNDHGQALDSPQRLASLRELALMDTPPEAAFDRLTALAARLLQTPVSLISLVDDHRQFFKAITGLTGPAAIARQTPLSHSFCQHVVTSGAPLVVNDAALNPLVRDNLAVRDLGVQAYLGVPVRAPDGAVIGSYCAIDGKPRVWTPAEVDLLGQIARLVETEIALRAAHDAALAESRNKTEFLATVSHEIRTPMNAIVGLSSLLQESHLGPAEQEMARTIHDAATSLLHLVNELLDLSRIEAGEFRIDQQEFAPAGLIEDTLRMFRERAQEKGLALESEIPPGISGVCVGDPARLRQMLVNLVSNALKFTVRGGVRVILREAVSAAGAARLRIEVKDTGVGIDPQRQPNLFQPFAHAVRLRGTNTGGSGLGLAITRRLAEAMGGTVGVSSESGVGSCFWFEVPVQSVADGAVAAADRVERGPAALRVLVVDDNEANRRLAHFILAQEGHAVEFAHDGRECLEKLAGARFNVVLLDCQMPHFDGYETTRRIRAGVVPGVDAKVPIIAVTAYARPEDRMACLAAGMNDYLAKPLRPQDLRCALDHWRGEKRDASPRSSAAAGAAATGIVPTAPVLDAEIVESIRGLGDEGPAVLAELVRLYRESVDEKLGFLRGAHRQNNGKALGDCAHAFGGSAASFGGKELRALCLQLEQQARGARWDAAALTLDEVAAACGRLEAELRRAGLWV